MKKHVQIFWPKTVPTPTPLTPPLRLHLLSLTHAQTHPPSTDSPLSGICGHSLCALMGKRRHPISPLAGPVGRGLMKKLLSNPIRALMASGPTTASPWPSEGLRSLGKQWCGRPGTHTLIASLWIDPNTAAQPAPQDTASHYSLAH